MAQIDVHDGESIESALRRFKRKVQRENILRDVKRHAYYVKPGDRDRIKRAVAEKRRNKRGRQGGGRYRRRFRRTELPAIAYETGQAVTE